MESLNAALDRLETWQAVITFALGYVLAAWQEGRRDSRQDRRDRDRQWRERQLHSIVELQVAISESLHGTWLANRAWENSLVSAAAESAEGKLRDVRDVTNEQWHQGWLVSTRKMATMATRVQDPELRSAVDRFMEVSAVIYELGDPEAIDREFAKLEDIAAHANLRAGQLYREFDAPAGNNDHRSLKNRLGWRSSRQAPAD